METCEVTNMKRLIALTALCCAASAAIVLPLENPTFANGFDGWTIWQTGNDPVLTSDSPYDTSGIALPSQSGVMQTLLLTPGTYEITGSVRGTGLAVECWKNNGTGYQMFGHLWSWGAMWHEETLSFTTTGGNVEVWFQNKTGLPLWLDLKPVHDIPEPSASALFAVVGLLAVGWRKR